MPKHNAAMTEETAASADALAQDTEELLTLIRTFWVSQYQSCSWHGVARQMRMAS